MACSDRARALVLHVDGELSPDETRPLLDHLAACADCRESLRLLGRERDLLSTARLGLEEVRPWRRSALRTAGIAAALLVLLGAGLSRLFDVYSTAGARLAAKRQAKQSEEIFGIRLTVRANGVPLTDFLEMLSKETGVSIRLNEAARPRNEPSVYFTLGTPVRLGSLVHLLEEIYGLRATVREGAVRFG